MDKGLYPSDFFPTLEEVKGFLKDGKYKRVPVCVEVLSDQFTPLELLKKLKSVSKHVFLFESADSNHKWGRYSFIGYDPLLEITCLDGELSISSVKNGEIEGKEVKKVIHPKDEIRKVINQFKSPHIEGLPSLSGGLVGYFSYDYIKYSEPELKLENKKGDTFRDVDLMAFDSIIAFDNERQKLLLITGVNTGTFLSKEDADSTYVQKDIDSLYFEAVKKLEDMANLILSAKAAEPEPLELKGELRPEYSEEKFTEMVEKAKHYIKEGDIFQAVLSNPVISPADGSLFDTYRLLRTENPSPYMFYFSSDDVEIAGSSPETLVKTHEGRVYTFPLAGTRKRGATEKEDKDLEKDLLSDEKECAEHNMLVDLGRNDIGKISKIGTVRVEKYMQIERFSHVMHIGSTVSGELKKECDAIDAVDAILPAGTLSGAPKFRACEIIEELEDRKRGIYGGAVGYLDFAGGLDTGIGIRLCYKKDGYVCVQSGAGIVYDSDPEKEYMETVNKAKAVIKALDKTGRSGFNNGTSN